MFIVQKKGDLMNEPKNNKSLKKNILMLGITSFFNDIGSEMILPILPLLITSVGGSGLAIGLIGGLRDSAAEALKAIFGLWSDRLTKRMPFIFSGYLMSGFFKLLLTFASSWPVILLLVGFERIGKALRTAPRDALITQSLPQQIGKGFGIHRALDTLGAILGSIITFILVWQWNLSFAIIIPLAALISFVSIFPLFKITEPPQTTTTAQPVANFKHFSPAFIRFTTIASLFSLSHVSYMFFILHAQSEINHQSSILFSMLLYVLFNIFYSACATPFGILSDKIGRLKMIVGGYSLYAITMFMLVIASSIQLFSFCFILYGIALAIINVNHKAYAADLSSPQHKATALGTFEAVTGLVILLANITVGFLWDQLLHHQIFVCTGTIALCAAILLIFIMKFADPKNEYSNVDLPLFHAAC